MLYGCTSCRTPGCVPVCSSFLEQVNSSEISRQISQSDLQGSWCFCGCSCVDSLQSVCLMSVTCPIQRHCPLSLPGMCLPSSEPDPIACLYASFWRSLFWKKPIYLAFQDIICYIMRKSFKVIVIGSWILWLLVTVAVPFTWKLCKNFFRLWNISLPLLPPELKFFTRLWRMPLFTALIERSFAKLVPWSPAHGPGRGGLCPFHKAEVSVFLSVTAIEP